MEDHDTAAFVTDRNDVFGMARMFELLAGAGPNEIRVFREMSEALDWLGLEPFD